MAATKFRFEKPKPGDVVLCAFPPHITGPNGERLRQRPGLILSVLVPEGLADDPLQVRVAYSSGNTLRVFPWELVVDPVASPDEFRSAGITSLTKFCLAQAVTCEYTSEWFSVPPIARYGRTPKLGEITGQLMDNLKIAYRNVDSAPPSARTNLYIGRGDRPRP